MSCQVCDLLATRADDALVFDDELFAAVQIGEVPGWIMLATKEHVEGLEGFGDAHADGFGRFARRAVAALKEATAADRIGLVYLGEHARHFHLGLFPRQPDQPSLFSNDALIAEMESGGDAAASASVRAAMRASLSAAA